MKCELNSSCRQVIRLSDTYGNSISDPICDSRESSASKIWKSVLQRDIFQRCKYDTCVLWCVDNLFAKKKIQKLWRITVSERKFNEEGVLQLSGGDFRLFTPTSSPNLSWSGRYHSTHVFSYNLSLRGVRNDLSFKRPGHCDSAAVPTVLAGQKLVKIDPFS